MCVFRTHTSFGNIPKTKVSYLTDVFVPVKFPLGRFTVACVRWCSDLVKPATLVFSFQLRHLGKFNFQALKKLIAINFFKVSCMK